MSEVKKKYEELCNAAESRRKNLEETVTYHVLMAEVRHIQLDIQAYMHAYKCAFNFKIIQADINSVTADGIQPLDFFSSSMRPGPPELLNLSPFLPIICFIHPFF